MTFYRRLILIMCVVVLLVLPARAEVVDRIVAVVNDEVITLYDLNRAFEPYQRNIENTYKGKDKDVWMKQARESLFQRLIDNILIEQEAKKSGIHTTVREEDVMSVVSDMLSKQKISMAEFQKNLAREGSSLEAVKKDIRSQIIRMKLLRREVRDKIMVTDDEIGEYYVKHREEYEGKESVRMKQIMLLKPSGATREENNKIKSEILRLRALIIQGESFDLLAAKYSQGPAAAQGGDVGFIEKGTIIPEVENVAFHLPLNKVSEVIESEMGYHIVQVIDQKGAGLKSIAMVREEIRNKIEEEKLDKKFGEWISSVREKSHIEIRL